jgi:hypothetical protein
MRQVRTEASRYSLPSQQAQAGQRLESFDGLLCKQLDATLGEYLTAVQEAQ